MTIFAKDDKVRTKVDCIASDRTINKGEHGIVSRTEENIVMGKTVEIVHVRFPGIPSSYGIYKTNELALL